MNQSVSYVLSLMAAVAIGGGGLYVLLHKPAPIVELRPQSAAQAATPPPPPAYQPATASQDRPSGLAIYRCERGGSVVYSDTPCQGGRVVDVRVTQGFEPQRGTQSARSQAVERAPAAPRTPAIAQANGSVDEALCAQISRRIERIDAAARAGGTITYMEDLKERRRKLVENRQELRC